MKKNTRLIIDISMTVMLPLLMAYSLIGEKFHEIAGTLMLVLFITHHILNRGWYKSLFKGKYSARRIFQTLLNMLLLVFMILQPLSGILMSKHLYTFIRIPGTTASARTVHLCLAYCGFVLMCLHAGTHLTVPFGKLQLKNKNVWIMMMILLSAASVYGIFAFVRRGLADYMFLKSVFVFFDFYEPRINFFLDYFSVMILFAFAGYWIIRGLTALETSEKGKKHESTAR